MIVCELEVGDLLLSGPDVYPNSSWGPPILIVEQIPLFGNRTFRRIFCLIDGQLSVLEWPTGATVGYGVYRAGQRVN